MSSCKQCREEWMLRFDAGERQPDWIAAHLEGCAGCRAFAWGAERAREAVGSIPLPPPDTAADRELLAALEARPESWITALRSLLTPARWRAALPLAVTGACSFAATLLVAGWLSAAPGDPAEVRPVSAVVPTEPRRVSADLERRLDAWLARPSPTALPLQPAELPVQPSARPAPARPVRRSQQGRPGPSA